MVEFSGTLSFQKDLLRFLSILLIFWAIMRFFWQVRHWSTNTFWTLFLKQNDFPEEVIQNLRSNLSENSETFERASSWQVVGEDYSNYNQLSHQGVIINVNNISNNPNDVILPESYGEISNIRVKRPETRGESRKSWKFTF